MHKKLKLVVLIITSLSVYFIYNQTKNSAYTIMNIGDSLSLGINSYGVKETSYVDYLVEEYQKTKEKVTLNDKYSTKDQTIQKVQILLHETTSIKKDLASANLLVITLGRNDLKFIKLFNENLTESEYQKEINQLIENYNDLIQEIKKYYHNDIVVIGYYSNNNDYFEEYGIQKINNFLKNNKDIIYIDTKELENNKQKYFSNPTSYYPNRYGYYVISKKIIRKNLANQ